MEEQIQKEYESLLETFNTDGWKLYSEELVGMFEQLRDTAHTECKTNDEWQFRRGQLEVLGRLMTYEEFQKAGYDAQQ